MLGAARSSSLCLARHRNPSPWGAPLPTAALTHHTQIKFFTAVKIV
jgi:hypothetical protein